MVGRRWSEGLGVDSSKRPGKHMTGGRHDRPCTRVTRVRGHGGIRKDGAADGGAFGVSRSLARGGFNSPMCRPPRYDAALGRGKKAPARACTHAESARRYTPWSLLWEPAATPPFIPFLARYLGVWPRLPATSRSAPSYKAMRRAPAPMRNPVYFGCLMVAMTDLNDMGSVTARSANTLRFSSMLLLSSPLINREYPMPCCRPAALIRSIHVFLGASVEDGEAAMWWVANVAEAAAAGW